MNNSILHFYQIYYAPGQLGRLDPAFIPYDNSATERPHEHEFDVFRQEYLAGKTREGLTGYLSWKFGEKTGISGTEFQYFCEQNPGRDVYFVNPFPIEIVYGNIWRQGEMWHPGITEIAQGLIDRCGYGIELKAIARRLSTLSFCNFWVGTAGFWDRYMAFCLPLVELIHSHADDALIQRLLSMGDTGRQTTYFSFIIERLFSTLLSVQSGISYASYRYSRHDLRQRYPGCYADFLADLQELEAQHPEDPEPIAYSERHQRFLRHQQQAMRLMNRPWLRRSFNQYWPRWQNSSTRQHLIQSRFLRQRERELFQLLNPAYVHWRLDLPIQG